jgi:hypothetical protein
MAGSDDEYAASNGFSDAGTQEVTDKGIRLIAHKPPRVSAS